MASQVSAPAVASHPIPFKQENTGAPTGLGSSGAAVLIISLVAIGVVLYLRKRFNLVAPLIGGSRLVRVRDTERLGPRAMLSVVEFDGKHFLLAQSEHGITCIASAAAPQPIKESP